MKVTSATLVGSSVEAASMVKVVADFTALGAAAPVNWQELPDAGAVTSIQDPEELEICAEPDFTDH